MSVKQSYDPARPSHEERRIMMAVVDLQGEIEKKFNIAANTSPYKKKLMEEAVNAVYRALGDSQTKFLTDSLEYAKKGYQGRVVTHKYKMSIRDLELTMKAVSHLAMDISRDLAEMGKGIFELKRVRNQVQHRAKKKMRGRAGEAFRKHLDALEVIIEAENKHIQKSFDDDFPSIPNNEKYDAVKSLERTAGITEDGRISESNQFE